MDRLHSLVDELYKVLLTHYGPQHWWPGETPFEVMIGAVLTQNTNWQNAERAIANLRRAKLLDPHRLARVAPELLAEEIRPAGYYNVKARRLRALVAWLLAHGDGRPERALAGPLEDVRRSLLAVSGVGPETADSILLYAGGRPAFVVDAYTRRILARHAVVAPDISYDGLKQFFEQRLPARPRLFNEYHALLVRLGKEACRPTARCATCPARTVFAAVGCPATVTT